MSSLSVRDAIYNYLSTSCPDEKFVDLTARFEELDSLLHDVGVGPSETWVGIEYFGGDENGITVGSTNTQGYYRENGAINVHIVGFAGLGNSRAVLVRAEKIRAVLRNKRLGYLTIDSVSPANTEQGATLNLEGGYFSASFLASYQYDFTLGS